MPDVFGFHSAGELAVALNRHQQWHPLGQVRGSLRWVGEGDDSWPEAHHPKVGRGKQRSSLSCAAVGKEAHTALAFWCGLSHFRLQRVLRGAFSQIGIGLGLGVPLAIVAGWLMTNQLFGVSPWDPRMLTTATLLLCVAALLASWIPAARAASVDPMVALRAE